MCSSREAAAKIVNCLRIPCCTRIFSNHAANSPLSFFHLVRDLGGTLLCLRACRAIRSVLEHIQASQQEPSREISPIDAAIDDCGTALYPLRFQGFSQLPVVPGTRLHPALYQQARLKPPVLHGLQFRLRSSGFGVKGKRTTNSFHIRRALFHWSPEGQLASILSHVFSSCLYLYPNHLEVITHA